MQETFNVMEGQSEVMTLTFDLHLSRQLHTVLTIHVTDSNTGPALKEGIPSLVCCAYFEQQLVYTYHSVSYFAISIINCTMYDWFMTCIIIYSLDGEVGDKCIIGK